VSAVVVAAGEDEQRWSAWLAAAGVRVERRAALSQALAMSPRPSVIVVDGTEGMAHGGEQRLIAARATAIVVSDEAREGSLTPGTVLYLPRPASRAALVGAVLAMAAGLRVEAPPASRGSSGGGSADRELLAPGGREDDDWSTESPTARERDVLALAALGLTNRSIAERLGISDHTVKFHLASAYAKLGARSRTQAVRRAIRRGWIAI
jgi:DNA-binding NarL/FixJ family response regulator